VFVPTVPEKISKTYYDEVYFAGIQGFEATVAKSLRRYRLRKIFEIYKPQPNEVVLDIGSAWGELSFALTAHARFTIGVDFSAKAAAFCAHQIDAKNSDKLAFLCADACHTGLKSNSVDVAISADLFEHLYPDQFEAVMDECRRVLKPGGRLVIWTPHRGHILEVLKNNNIVLKPDKSHVDYKSMRTLVEALNKRGFTIEKRYYAESHLPVLRSMERLLMGWIPLLRRRIAILARKPA
jgi:cyclopropane fatty-acyl-phospholipid synthase-like methyltransferase